MKNFAQWIMLFLFTMLVVNKTYAQPQPGTISGVILDAKTNEPVQFANVVIPSLKMRVSTDTKGRFSIANIPIGSHQVIFSFIGYKTEKQALTTNQPAVIKLQSLEYMMQAVSVFSRKDQKSPVNIDEVGTVSLSSETVQKTSGMLKDAFRSVQTMAGVSGNNELSARFNVRGGNQDENLVLVNGTQVFEPYHIKYAAAASIGVFNIDLVNSIDMMTGGFSAQYGDRMSSVLNLQYREGNREKVQGHIGISLTNFDALLEGPIFDKGSFIIGARRSFVEYMLKALNIEEGVHPAFYDVQGQFSFDLTPAHKVSLQFVHSGDDFLLDPIVYNNSNAWQNSVQNKPADFTFSDREVENINNGYSSTMVSLRSITILSPSTLFKLEGSYYYQHDDESRVYEYKSRTEAIEKNVGTNQRRYYNSFDRQSSRLNQLNITTAELRATLETQVMPWYEVRVGAAYQNIHYSQDLRETDERISQSTFTQYPDTSVRKWSGLPADYTPQYIDARSFKSAGYIENIFQIGEELTLNVGGRADYFDINQDLNLSPRASLSYKAPFGVRFRTAWGYYYQSPLYQQLRLSYRSDTNTKAQRATHYIISAERQFELEGNAALTVKLEGYYKYYHNLISVTRAEGTNIVYSRRNDAEGFARGLDLTVSFAKERLNGWLSYGLLDAQERLYGDNTLWYPRFTDQRHTLSLVADYDLGAGWTAGVRFAYGSGFAYTPFTASYNESNKQWSWVRGAKNSAHFPSYQRVDIRADKKFSMFGLSSIVFMDISNVLNRTNVLSYSFGLNANGTLRQETNNLWPIVPTLGLTVQF